MVDAAKYVITFDPDGARPSGDTWGYAPVFVISSGSKPIFTASMILSRSAYLDAMHRLGRDRGDDDPLKEAARRFVIGRAEEVLRNEALRADAIHAGDLEWTLTSDDETDLELLVALAPQDDKRCDYQLRYGRDLFCTVPSSNDATADRVIHGSTVAPTSQPICLGCAVPDERARCSDFTHPRVLGYGLGGPPERTLSSVICAAGNQDAASAQPELCVAGGHECWTRAVVPELDQSVAASPWALPEALDFLDSAWNVVFRKRLLNLRTAADTAGLVMGCSSRAEFEARMSDLAEALDALNVDDADIPASANPEETKKSLGRVAVVLQARLDAEAAERVAVSCQALRRIVRVRVALQHAGAASEMPVVFNQLGMQWPPESWGVAWEHLRARASSEINAIRDEVRHIT